MNDQTPTAPAAPAAAEKVDIDLNCMKTAEDIFQKLKAAEKPEKTVNEALAVLKENGLYALVIYLEAKFEYDRNRNLKENAYSRLSQGIDDTGKKLFQWTGAGLREKVKNLSATDNVFKLFLAIDVIEQTLIYTRYLVKGLPKPQPQSAGPAPYEGAEKVKKP
jgi:hypothetical protein